MLKRCVALFLTIVILLPVIGKSWILISFKLNQESIAQNLCVQRNVKNNSCHGCCQLKKRLAEKDKQEQKQLPRGSNEKSSFIADYFIKELTNTFYFSSSRKSSFQNHFGSLLNVPLEGLFRPPQAALNQL